MRSSLFVAFVAASALALAGCGSSSVGGSGGSGGATGGSGGTAGDHGGTGGAGGQGGTSASTDCNPACTGQTVCVGVGVEGGAVILAGDGGTCPQGRHLQGDTCVQELSYSCMAIPSGCNGTPTCSCAAGTLCTSGHTCTQVSSNELTCVILAP